MAREGLCNPAAGHPHYSHDGGGAVAGKPAAGSTIGNTPANKPPLVTGRNMNLSNMGGMEHVQTAPTPSDDRGARKGGPAKLSVRKGPPGPSVSRNVNEV